MHELAREVYRDLGGEAVEEHLAIYAEIVALWRQGGPERPPMREALRCMGARERGFARRDKLRETAWLQARAEVFQRTGERIPLPHTPESMDHQESAEERAMVRQLSQKLRQVSAFTEGLEFGKGLGLGTGQGSGLKEGSGCFYRGSMREKVPDPGGASAGKGSGTFYSQTTAQKMSQTPEPEKEPDPAPPVVSSVERPTNKQIKIGIRRLIGMQIDRKVVNALEAQARSGRMSRAEFVRRIEQMMGVMQSA
jgi:hypothetical protein